MIALLPTLSRPHLPFAILMFGALDAKLILNGISIIGCIYPILRCWRQIRLRDLVKIAAFMLVGAGIAQIAGPVLYSDQFRAINPRIMYGTLT